MPELPEVETVKRGLEPFMQGKVIQSVCLKRKNLRIPFPPNLKNTVEGKQCLTLRRRGKYMAIDIDGGQSLIVHLGMSGSFRIITDPNAIQIKAHDHVIITMETGTTIIYNDPRRFGMMFTVLTDHENTHPAFAVMGPEPLGNAFNGEALIQKTKNKKSPIKTALLDQSVVAGVGNIYACEALYLAGISPLRPANTLSEEEAETLAAAIKTVLQDAINSGGSSLRDHKQVDGTMGYFQHRFNVYGREGEKCPETGDTILKIVQSGRSTFYCPQKQR